ncbi:hypothetical protein SAMN05216419_100828 [Nitrosomonas cryotolerans]|nr:hypothetical protein SAMN05216419_100828 [Nitrosomonas cryotolerans]
MNRRLPELADDIIEYDEFGLDSAIHHIIVRDNPVC